MLSFIFETISLYDLSPVQWIFVFSCSLLVGTAKAGISGVGVLVVPIMASVFGGKLSTGVLLPMLCFADVLAVKYYNRHADFGHILKLMPYTFMGLLMGMIIGHQISENGFRILLSLIIIGIVILMLLYELNEKNIKIPHYWWFSAIMGLAGGFVSMVGNAAAPVMALYFLSMRLPKNSFIGTTAWFFFLVNLTKIPLHFFVWKTISLESLVFGIIQIPVIVLGAFLGIQLVKIFPEKKFRYFIIISTFISALLLLQP